MVITAQDVTISKQIEASLKESESNFRNLINGMVESAWVIDFEGNFVDVNDTASERLGYSREELFSLGIKDIDKHLSPEKVQNLTDSLPAVGITDFRNSSHY